MTIIESKYNTTIDTAYLIIMLSIAFRNYWNYYSGNATEKAAELIINKPYKEDGEFERLTTPIQFESLPYADCDDKVIEYLSAQYFQYGYRMNGNVLGVVVMQPIGQNTYTHIYNVFYGINEVYELDLTYPDQYGLTNHTAIKKSIIIPTEFFYNWTTLLIERIVKNDVIKYEKIITEAIVEAYEHLLDGGLISSHFAILDFPEDLNPIPKDTFSHGFK